MLYVGIDVHRRTHEVVILDAVGKPHGKSFKIGNTHHDLAGLFERIAKSNPEGEVLRFGMEATGHYWLALYSHLNAAGHEVIILNPLRTHAYRARSVRPAKNDRIAARCIAEIIRTEPKSDYYLTDEDQFALRQLTRLRVELVDMVSDQKRRLLTLLDQAFPEFETFFREKYCKSALAVLQAYPTPEAILAADIDELTLLLEKSSRKRYGREKAEEITRAARQSFGVPFGQRANGLQIQLLAGQITYLEAQQKQLDREINVYLDAIPNCLTTISGIGRILAAVFLGEIGDIRRFRNAKALVAYAGMDPSVIQSGEFTAKKAHLSKRGSTHLRRAIWLAAAAAVRNDEALKALHEKKLAEGKPFHVALGAVANKLLHIIYAVLRDNKPYYSPSLARAVVAA
ncbi:MAG: IS110 family transposase [Anaerolineae bacterium]|nr:IS110 family transposase [Anaerolineae bacterium]